MLSFLCRSLRDPGSPLLIFVSKGGFRAKRFTGCSFLGKTPPGPKSSFNWFQVVLSKYLDGEFRPYRFSAPRDLSLFITCFRSLNWLKFWGGFSISVAVEELKISGAEVPATVAPAETSLNDRFYAFTWDSRAQNVLLLYIHNIQLSKEVDYLNSRDRTGLFGTKRVFVFCGGCCCGWVRGNCPELLLRGPPATPTNTVFRSVIAAVITAGICVITAVSCVRLSFMLFVNFCVASPCLATVASSLSSRFATVPIDVCKAATSPPLVRAGSEN